MAKSEMYTVSNARIGKVVVTQGQPVTYKRTFPRTMGMGYVVKQATYQGLGPCLELSTMPLGAGAIETIPTEHLRMLQV